MPKLPRLRQSTPSKVKISVIIPCYNYGHFLAAAIESVQHQTAKHVEIIVVNDGSTDNTAEVAATFGQAIRYVEQVNQGVVVARNTGARMAEGDYLCFLDADDALDPQYLQQLSRTLDNSDPSVAFAYCDFALVDHERVIVHSCPWNKHKLLYRNYLIAAAVVRKSAFTRVGGFTENAVGNNIYEDWDLWLKLASSGYRGEYVPQVLYEYRQHNASRSKQGQDQRQEFEHDVAQRYPKLYKPLDAQLYLAFYRTASRVRNTLFPPPGN